MSVHSAPRALCTPCKTPAGTGPIMGTGLPGFVADKCKDKRQAGLMPLLVFLVMVNGCPILSMEVREALKHLSYLIPGARATWS